MPGRFPGEPPPECTFRVERFALHRACQAQASPAANQNRRLNQSPTDALIDLVSGGRLCCQIPVGLHLDTLAHLRITLAPKRRPTCRGNAWWLRTQIAILGGREHGLAF